MTERLSFDTLVARLLALPADRRQVVAVAGPPGAGKSTFAARLVTALRAGRPTGLLAMDGYHFDDRVLNERGHRPRKGAPHTFDVDGLAAMLDRLRADDGRDIAVPVFDRDIEIARAGAAILSATARIVVVEGNYLLLDDPAWASLRERFDTTVFLSVPYREVERRLFARWKGYDYSDDQLRQKMEGNDLPNVRLVLDRSVPADFEVANV